MSLRAGLLVSSLSAMKEDYQNEEYKLYSILLLNEQLSIYEFMHLVQGLDWVTGRDIGIYYFFPRIWNIREGSPIRDFPFGEDEKISQLQEAIMRGTKEFAKYIAEKGVSRIPAIARFNEVMSFDRSGIFFFEREAGLSQPNKGLYLPLPLNMSDEGEFLSPPHEKLEKIFECYYKKGFKTLNTFSECLNKRKKDIYAPDEERKDYGIVIDLVSAGISLASLLLRLASSSEDQVYQLAAAGFGGALLSYLEQLSLQFAEYIDYS